ncbi:TPA: hypothetical protein SHW33_004138 [Clostridioides difficile]|uniref:rhodanese-related sulfurtransferase n=1 Tax=Clostridium phage phiCD6356 TaxID=864178 RepID=UPI0001DE02A5|nr:hypothetical protein [Clostridioides difficile]YP_004306124.1 rhodanese-related sulfurtransferase [Clostridium phage phiCD6356]ADK37885.1 hypothetical protein phiCD6356_23 [Clostridium phage phiCD6356]EGT4856647.1 hypothetical protein [Clostridioides difficile]EGT5248046.1 hypothetical protein [Clostridioides difficile]EGT5284687.1 hypothetical protein [Clostridioides difficile]EJX3466010.1 hypothetical protein [Clostridioides difficile]
MNVPNRVIYDQTGRIIFETGESCGDVLPHDKITELHYIDVEYGSIDYTRNKIVGINIETKEPVLEEIPAYISKAEKEKQELENQLLLMTNKELGGGIL